MFVQSLLGAVSKFYLASKLLKGLAALLLGVATLWWIIEQVEPPGGTAIVHVIESDVEVIVGGQSYFEDQPNAVIECRLRAGRHRFS